MEYTFSVLTGFKRIPGDSFTKQTKVVCHREPLSSKSRHASRNRRRRHLYAKELSGPERTTLCSSSSSKTSQDSEGETVSTKLGQRLPDHALRREERRGRSLRYCAQTQCGSRMRNGDQVVLESGAGA